MARIGRGSIERQVYVLQARCLGGRPPGLDIGALLASEPEVDDRYEPFFPEPGHGAGIGSSAATDGGVYT